MAVKTQRVELAVFLLLIVPAMAASFLVTSHGGPKLSFAIIALATIARDLALVCLILFFLWRNGEPFSSIGWTTRNMVRELFVGVILFLPFGFGVGVVGYVLTRFGLSHPPPVWPPPITPGATGQLLLAILLVIVVAISEETIFRGYLLLRARALHPGTTFGVIFSAFVFSLGHGYEGWAGVITIGITGAALALIYLRRGSLIAPMTLHFLQDFSSLVIIPLLNRHR